MDGSSHDDAPELVRCRRCQATHPRGYDQWLDHMEQAHPGEHRAWLAAWDGFRRRMAAQQR